MNKLTNTTDWDNLKTILIQETWIMNYETSITCLYDQIGYKNTWSFDQTLTELNKKSFSVIGFVINSWGEQAAILTWKWGTYYSGFIVDMI